MRIVSSSPRTTQALASTLAEEFMRHPPTLPHATIIALTGPLGAGKTTFVQAFARAMGVRRNLPSPTFVFIRRYALRGRHYRNLFHMDAYRVKRATKKILAPLGLLEEFKNPENLFLIEWAEHLGRALPPRTIRATFRHAKQAHERIVVFGK